MRSPDAGAGRVDGSIPVRDAGEAFGEEARRAAYRELFRGALEEKPLNDLRLALNQDQPIGNDRVYRDIEAMTGQRRELRRRGRPRKRDEEASAGDARQGELPL